VSGCDEWQATERMLDGGGVESRQRVLLRTPAVEASRAGAHWLGVTYWRAVDGFTLGAVRATWHDEGGRLRLLGGLTLFRFSPPQLQYADGIVSCRYAIEGGLLALRAGGSVTLAQRPDGAEYELSVTVEEYLPRLAARARAPRWTGVLFVKGQNPLHAAVSRRYFESIVGERAA
jgi:hypothetical protein